MHFTVKTLEHERSGILGRKHRLSLKILIWLIPRRSDKIRMQRLANRRLVSTASIHSRHGSSWMPNGSNSGGNKKSRRESDTRKRSMFLRACRQSTYPRFPTKIGHRLPERLRQSTGNLALR